MQTGCGVLKCSRDFLQSENDFCGARPAPWVLGCALHEELHDAGGAGLPEIRAQPVIANTSQHRAHVHAVVQVTPLHDLNGDNAPGEPAHSSNAQKSQLHQVAESTAGMTIQYFDSISD